MDVLEPISFGLRKFSLAVDKGIKRDGKMVVDRTLRDQVVKKLFNENVTLRKKTADRDLNKSVEVLKKDNDVLKLCNIKQSRLIFNLKQESVIKNQMQHECVICFESVHKPGLLKILECGHVFHDECVKILSKCPLDRSVV
jgi:predicted Zn-ribbon and HTH transcriptional regulator